MFVITSLPRRRDVEHGLHPVGWAVAVVVVGEVDFLRYFRGCSRRFGGGVGYLGDCSGRIDSSGRID